MAEFKVDDLRKNKAALGGVVLLTGAPAVIRNSSSVTKDSIFECDKIKGVRHLGCRTILFAQGANMTPSEDYRLIPLTQGQFAKVSPLRFEELSKFTWHARWSKNTQTFYAARSVRLSPDNWRVFLMHRHILGLELSGGGMVDHRNGDTLDNTDDNLRHTDSIRNGQNRKTNRNNKSGLKGVSWSTVRRKWMSQITVEKRQVTIGFFDDKEDAYKAYCEAAKIHFGEFARIV